jgi:hypothetical protein
MTPSGQLAECYPREKTLPRHQLVGGEGWGEGAYLSFHAQMNPRDPQQRRA